MPNDKTWTWDHFAKSSSQVTEKLGSQGVYGSTGSASAPPNLAPGRGRRARKSGRPTARPQVTQATITSYFDYANKLVAAKATPPASGASRERNSRSRQSLFATNKAAFHSCSILRFGLRHGQRHPDETAPPPSAGRPANRRRVVNKASMYWSVAARRKAAEAAAKLVDFLITDPAATKVLITERGIPAIPAVQKEVAPLLDPQAQIALEFSQTIPPSSCRHLKSPHPTPPASVASSPPWPPRCSSVGPAQRTAQPKCTR